MSEHREIPNNIDAERSVLGACQQWPQRVLPSLAKVGLKPEHFHYHTHGNLFEAFLRMEREGTPIDTVTLGELLTQSDSNQRFGGISKVLEMQDFVPSGTNAGYHGKLIVEAAKRRHLINTLRDAQTAAYDAIDDPVQVADRAIAALSSETMRVGVGGLRRIGEDMADIVHVAQNPDSEDVKRRSCRSTGFWHLDHLLGGGAFGGDLVILAGRPGMGKSALAMQIATNWARGKRKGDELAVAVFSLEMGQRQLEGRLLATEGQADARAIRSGRNVTSEDIDKVVWALKRFESVPLFIDEGALAMSDIVARAKRLANEEGQLGGIVIDYLQLVKEEPGSGRRNREQAVAAMSRTAKLLGKSLDCPVLLLSQLNRSVESRGTNKRPRIADLRESGAIEQDADIVSFVYREEYYRPNKPECKGQAEVIIAKQRSGPTGCVHMDFDGRSIRFTSVQSEEAKRRSAR